MPRWPASFVAHGHDGERQVRPVEPGRDPRRVAQPEAGDDVVGDLRRRRRGRGDDGLRAEPARRVGEAEVVRAEVVPPLGDAVRLVDHEQPDLGLPDPLEEAGRREPLRGDVEQPRAAADRAVERRAVRRRVLLRVDHRHLAGRDALERLDLVLHERDERRDDDREVRAHERGELVAERLARARRHDDEHVAARRWRPRPPPAGPGRKAGNPNTSRSASAGSVARANGVGGSGPSPGSAGATSGSVTRGALTGSTTIALGPVATGGFSRDVTKLAQSRHGFVTKRARSRHPEPSCLRPCRSTATASKPSTPASRTRSQRRTARSAEHLARARERMPDGVPMAWMAGLYRPPADRRRARRRLPLHRPRRQRVPRLQPGRPQRLLRLRARARAGGDRRARPARAPVPAPGRGGARRGRAARGALRAARVAVHALGLGRQPGGDPARPPPRPAAR